MTRYIIADGSTGEILRTVECDAEQAAVQAEAGELMVAHATATATTHYVSGDPAAVAYSGPEAAAKAARPDGDFSWSNWTMAWVDNRSLAIAQDEQWGIIKAERTATETGGFVWDGSTFDSDYQSQARIQGAVLTALIASIEATPFSIDWTLADDSVRTLSGAEMLLVGKALGEHVVSVFEAGRAAYAAIQDATTPAEVTDVVWTPP